MSSSKGNHFSQLRISNNPGVMSSETVFRGTRVPVLALLNNIEAGLTLDEFLDNFLTVTRDQAIQILEFSKEDPSFEQV